MVAMDSSSPRPSTLPQAPLHRLQLQPGSCISKVSPWAAACFGPHLPAALWAPPWAAHGNLFCIVSMHCRWTASSTTGPSTAYRELLLCIWNTFCSLSVLALVTTGLFLSHILFFSPSHCCATTFLSCSHRGTTTIADGSTLANNRSLLEQLELPLVWHGTASELCSQGPPLQPLDTKTNTQNCFHWSRAQAQHHWYSKLLFCCYCFHFLFSFFFFFSFLKLISILSWKC